MRALSDLKLGEEPEVGVTYLVPCMNLAEAELGGWEYCLLEGSKPKLTAVPIIGNPHEDPEFHGAGGEMLHTHLDTRFITFNESLAWKLQEEQYNGNGPDFNFPIIGLARAKKIPEVFMLPKVCQRKIANLDYVKPGEYGSDYREFEDKMEKHTIKLDNPICPHHGTSLKSQCVRDGKVVCPLHGLIWDATTGKLIRKTKKRVSTSERPGIIPLVDLH